MKNFINKYECIPGTNNLWNTYSKKKLVYVIKNFTSKYEYFKTIIAKSKLTKKDY